MQVEDSVICKYTCVRACVYTYSENMVFFRMGNLNLLNVIIKRTQDQLRRA